MRVIRVISHLDVGGVQRQMLLAFRDLRERDIHGEVCVLKKRGNWADIFEKEGFPVHLVRFRTRFDPLGLLRLRALAAQQEAQVVHGHMYNANMAVNAAFIVKAGISTVNGYHNQIMASNVRQERRIGRSARYPDSFVAVGNSVKDTLVRLGVPARRVDVVQNGVVPPDEITPVPDRQPGEPLRLVWAGRFVEQKRTDLLIDVAQACKQAGVAIHITLLGEGPQLIAMRRKVEEEDLGDVVSMPGRSSDVFGELAKAHFYCSASYREGFPNALLEACAAGRPSITSDIDPHTEILEGTNAGFCVSAEVKDWVEALRPVAEGKIDLSAMSRAASEIAETYSVRAACDRTEVLYQRITAK